MAKQTIEAKITKALDKIVPGGKSITLDIGKFSRSWQSVRQAVYVWWKKQGRDGRINTRVLPGNVLSVWVE